MSDPLLESVTGESIFAEIEMLQSAEDKAVLLVEGVSDQRLLWAHVDHDSTRILICHGSANLDRSIRLVDDHRKLGVLALRDRDWIGVLDPVPTSRSIVLTDLYDLEASVILLTSAIFRALPQVADMEAVSRHLEASGFENVPGQLISLTEHVGIARLVGHRDDLDLRMARFPIREIANESCDAVDVDKLVSVAVARSDTSVTRAELSDKITSAMGRDWAGAAVVCGHDLVSAIACLVQKAWGGYQSRRSRFCNNGVGRIGIVRRPEIPRSVRSSRGVGASERPTGLVLRSVTRRVPRRRGSACTWCAEVRGRRLVTHPA